MKIIRDIDQMKRFARAQERAGKTIGFVPTMGYLHDGHASLFEASGKENDISVVSIFVNPAQFGPKEDFKKYPRDLGRDEKILRQAGCDALFYPSKEDIYPEGYSTFVTVEGLSDMLCGKTRPGHFRGVSTIVTKLFEIVRPDKAYFGQKDYQQALILRTMAKDLNMDVDVKVMPIIREPDGLAMSSRNMYLDGQERADARVLSEGIKKAVLMFKQGERRSREVISEIKKMIAKKKTARADYIKIVDTVSLKDIDMIKDKALLALAVYVGKTRLIDNIILGM